MGLTDAKVRNAMAGDKAVKLFDGGGLFLFVTPSGYKSWRYKFRLDGKEKLYTIGAYPEIGLLAARNAHDDARKLVRDGIDPNIVRKQERRNKAAEDLNTFELIAREWHGKFHAKDSDYDKQVLRRFEADMFPFIGAMPITAVTPVHLHKALQKIEGRGAIESAHRMRQKCSQVFCYAVRTSRVERDVAADLRGAIPPAETKHYAAITDPQQLGGLLRAIDGDDCSFVVKCALQLAPLVFLRPGVLRKATWPQVDFDAAKMEIPGALMKKKEPLIVPLSPQALEILAKLKSLTGHGRYLFPSNRSLARPMSENTLNAGLRRLGYSKDEVTSHGFRATARTIIDEILEVRPDFIEHQLAHIVRDTNGRAYNRTKYLRQRRAMMNLWADYLDRLKKGGEDCNEANNFLSEGLKGYCLANTDS